LHRDALLRAVLNTGLAVDAFGHIDRLCLAVLEFEDSLRAHIHASTITIALAFIYGYHDHTATSSS
jgi:hypothetical protein